MLFFKTKQGTHHPTTIGINSITPWNTTQHHLDQETKNFKTSM